MSDAYVVLNQLNIITNDFDSTLSFYQQLGLKISENVSHNGIRHAEITFDNGFTLEFDDYSLARIYNAAWRRPEGSSSALIGFTLPTREAVDKLYSKLIADGYEGRQAPYDSFWGARYAVIADPAGNDVGLMSPISESCRTWPPTESPTSDSGSA